MTGLGCCALLVVSLLLCPPSTITTPNLRVLHVFVVLDVCTGLLDVIRMAHTIILPPRGTTATLELTHEGNINDKTIPERDRRVRVFNVTMLKSASRRHLVIDTHRTDLGVT